MQEEKEEEEDPGNRRGHKLQPKAECTYRGARAMTLLRRVYASLF